MPQEVGPGPGMDMPEDDHIHIKVDDPFARKLMARYLGRRETDVVSLRSALEQKDFSSIELTGHNLSGSGSIYGLDRISQLGLALEDAAERRDCGAIGQFVDELAVFIRDLKIN